MWGSRTDLRPGHMRYDLLLSVCGLVGGCAASADPGVGWEPRTAAAELERAQQAERSGERERALELGRRALQRAREAAALDTAGRAMLLVGRLETDLALCLEAVTVFEYSDDLEGLAEAQIAVASVLLALGRPGDAVDRAVQADLALSEARFERPDWARLSARLHHTAALALRELGRRDEAQARERQAELALSLLDDGDELALRIQVHLGLGAGEELNGWPVRAIEHQSRALDLAQRTGDREAQLEALTGVVRSLTDLRRYSDAVSHCERALDLARDLDDPARVQDLGRRGLELLGRLGDSAASARRQAFEQALLTGT